MIDIIVNTEGGIVLVHDEPALDGARALRVDLMDGAALLVFGQGRDDMPLACLAPSMRHMIGEAMELGEVPGRIVRMNGWSLASASCIQVVSVQSSHEGAHAHNAERA